jgi:hypothetical protein
MSIAVSRKGNDLKTKKTLIEKQVRSTYHPFSFLFALQLYVEKSTLVLQHIADKKRKIILARSVQFNPTPSWSVVENIMPPLESMRSSEAFSLVYYFKKRFVSTAPPSSSRN